jgi:hypothetical protein
MRTKPPPAFKKDLMVGTSDGLTVEGDEITNTSVEKVAGSPAIRVLAGL